jgi:hypothetical protein
MKTVRKMFWSLDNDKEIKFLQDWAKKGYRLVSVSLGEYVFEPFEATDLVYQMDFRGFEQFVDKEEYRQLFIDDGWQVIETDMGWYYFYKPLTGDADVSIFNNNESLIRSLKSKLRFLLLTGFPTYLSVLILLPAVRRSLQSSSVFLDIITVILIIIFIAHISFIAAILLKIKKLSVSIQE